jgi:hypothetical protein
MAAHSAFCVFCAFCGNSADRCAFVTFVAFCGKGAVMLNFFSVHGRRPSRALGGVVPLSGGLRRPAILRRPCRDWKSCFADSERLWKSQRAMIRGQKSEVGGQRAVNFVSNFVSNFVGNFVAHFIGNRSPRHCEFHSRSFVFIRGWIFRTEGLNREWTPMDANGCALGFLRLLCFLRQFGRSVCLRYLRCLLWERGLGVQLFLGSRPTPLQGSGGCGAFVRGLAPPGYPPASLPGLEELLRRRGRRSDVGSHRSEVSQLRLELRLDLHRTLHRTLHRKPQSAPLRVPFAFIRVHSRLKKRTEGLNRE